MADKKMPWREGIWRMGEYGTGTLIQTSGRDRFYKKLLITLDYPHLDEKNDYGCMKVEYGNFGRAREEITNATGAKDYNFKVNSFMGVLNSKGVVNADGTKITIWGMSDTLEEWYWLDEEEVQKIKDDREPFDAPRSLIYSILNQEPEIDKKYEKNLHSTFSCPHISPKPGKKGKIYWLTGPPGSGKSTTAQWLARDNDIIYYEADCTARLINPFVDVNVENPSIASIQSKPLKEVPEDTVKAIQGIGKVWEHASKGGEFDKEYWAENSKPLYKVFTTEIVKQQKRLGGSFAVANAVALRAQREYMCDWVGPDLVFIVLNLTEECIAARLKQRHGNSGAGEALKKIFTMFEPAGDDEKNAYNVTVEEGMSRHDVMKKCFELIQKIE